MNQNPKTIDSNGVNGSYKWDLTHGARREAQAKILIEILSGIIDLQKQVADIQSNIKSLVDQGKS